MPCFLGMKTDETGWNYDDSYQHVESLQCLSLDRLPSGLLPAEEFEIRARLEPGKAILEFIDGFQNDLCSIPKSISDDDLWDILQWRPKLNTWGLYDVQPPPREWKQWAKNAFMNGPAGDSHKRICCLLQVALDCYSSVSKKSQTIAYYYDAEGLHENRLEQLFDAWAFLSEKHGWYDFGGALSEALANRYLQKSHIYDRFEYNGDYYTLTFLGRKIARDLIGAPPDFFDAFDELWSSGESVESKPPALTKIKSSAVGIGGNATSSAQSLANGKGGKGGDGGDANSAATVAFEKDSFKLANKQTVNVEDRTPETIEQIRGLLDDDYRRRTETATAAPSLMPADKPLVDDPSPPVMDVRGDTVKGGGFSGYVSANELSEKHGVKLVTLKKRLERFRQQGHNGWIEVTDRGPNDPQFMYLEDTIKHLLEKK